jgi:NAD(P)-dependent dehydrogenase (short-subunit alcohol dehydrogenase family)
MKLEGKVAIVTGGGQGIGEGIVRCLAEEGADVAIMDMDGDSARQLAAELESMGRKSLVIAADATENGPIEKAVADTLDYFGQIDILVNNVGGSKNAPLRDGPAHITNRPEEEWLGSYEINLKSHILMAKAVVPHFMEKNSGKIVNISSAAGKNPDAPLMPYATFKAGDIAFSRCLALELAPNNINVNCVLPGFIYSPLWAGGAEGILAYMRMEAQNSGNTARVEQLEKVKPKEWWLENIVKPNTPMKREQSAADIGRAVVFLVSEDARNITGQALSVDGGMVTH